MKVNIYKLNLAIANQCITVTDLCHKAGIAEVTLRKIRAGERNPKPATIGKIAKALNVNVQDIIAEG